MNNRRDKDGEKSTIVPIKMEKLKEAFNFSSDDVTHYLNIKLGKIAMHSNFGGAFDEEGHPIRESNPFDKDHYIEIPGILYYEAYRDMERFTQTVTDTSLQKKLRKAIAGKGAFRRFAVILLDHPEERERWANFQEECIRERIFKWLEENNLELGD